MAPRFVPPPLSELGFVRLSTNVAYTPYARTPLEAALLLTEFKARSAHSFLAELPPLGSAVFQEVAKRLQGHKQVTDAFLLVVAREHDKRLLTFDRRIARINPWKRRGRRHAGGCEPVNVHLSGISLGPSSTSNRHADTRPR